MDPQRARSSRCWSPARTPARPPIRPSSAWAGPGCSTASSPRPITTPTGGWRRLARRRGPAADSRRWEPIAPAADDPEIPAGRVCALPLRRRLLRGSSRARPAGRPAVGLKRLLAQARTDLVRSAAGPDRGAPSPGGGPASSATSARDGRLPLCRRLGIPTILSMVHGDVREEVEVLDREAEGAPEFFPIYLGDGLLDREELDWLHRRRLRDLALADLILVPSDHIAERSWRHGTCREKIRVIPYAADSAGSGPLEGKRHGPACTFLFAGGITQRKGIKYLLEAWERVRRPGWRLQLLGALPENPGPLAGLLDQVELLGRVGHAEMPARMAAADVFVFPSLFEGSAVVTYEALACGLPSVVTPAAGSVVRDGVEGFVVAPRDVDRLARRMEQLGSSPAASRPDGRGGAGPRDGVRLAAVSRRRRSPPSDDGSIATSRAGDGVRGPADASAAVRASWTGNPDRSGLVRDHRALAMRARVDSWTSRFW